MSLDDSVNPAIVEQLELLLRVGLEPSEAVNQLVRAGISRESVEVAAAWRERQAEIMRTAAFDLGAGFEPESAEHAWYTGPSEYDKFWPALESALSEDGNWTAAIPSIDATSTSVVGLLAQPNNLRITTRGLVLGYVQSGKTANFTATIAKAADAGYRLFIVLSGVHNSLRRQTQLRLARQLTDLNPAHWVSLTSETDDFGDPVKALPLLAGSQLRMLAVVKKNASRLKRLKKWLYDANEHGGFDTCPVLIIDDEADQASPNSSRNPELDRTKINGLLSDLLTLPRVAYVGYTATPFANVLVDPESPVDIYPRNFIFALPRPDEYFGAEELFGLDNPPEGGPAGHDVIRFVGDEEAKQHVVKSSQPFQASVTPEMRRSVLWFLLATACRRYRSGTTPHSTMLIHTTDRIAPHYGYQPILRDLLRDCRKRIESNDSALIEELESFWVDEQQREPPDRFGLPATPFESLLGELPSVTDDAKVIVDNGSSPERLIYDDGAASTVIAVGGNTLSRGLTLEGLVSSYFLRSSRQYDTLLQMGRWFGYRPDFEDLPRIWTTSELAQDFRSLAMVEKDLRSEIDRYRLERTSPLDYGVRIRLIPGMQVTAKLKMQFVRPAAASFSGQRPQTIYFAHKDPGVVEGNLQAARTIVQQAQELGAEERDVPREVVFYGLPVQHILEFLNSYRFHPRADLDPELMCDYIVKQNARDQLLEWNVAIMRLTSDAAGTVDLGYREPINLIRRSKLDDPDTDTANIGTLMSKEDRIIDVVAREPQTPIGNPVELLDIRDTTQKGLLILYPIAKDSDPKDEGRGRDRTRKKMDAYDDLVGVAVSFPRAPTWTHSADWIEVDLSRVAGEEPTVDDGDDLDDYGDAEGTYDEINLGDDSKR